MYIDNICIYIIYTNIYSPVDNSTTSSHTGGEMKGVYYDQCSFMYFKYSLYSLLFQFIHVYYHALFIITNTYHYILLSMGKLQIPWAVALAVLGKLQIPWWMISKIIFMCYIYISLFSYLFIYIYLYFSYLYILFMYFYIRVLLPMVVMEVDEVYLQGTA